MCFSFYSSFFVFELRFDPALVPLQTDLGPWGPQLLDEIAGLAFFSDTTRKKMHASSLQIELIKESPVLGEKQGVMLSSYICSA